MNSSPSDRQAWMRILALSSWNDLKSCTDRLATPDFDVIRPPETGLIMVRGRMGGTGATFNLGEATVTRCAVRSTEGHEGHAYVMGRNQAHAKMAAICDALLQGKSHRTEIRTQLLEPLQKLLAERHSLAAHKAAATKVDFFTLVRGEDD